jgi:hypothetical protein
VNAEVFSAFGEALRNETRRVVYAVAYANGVIGYLPAREAYDEGGYEVETAHYFYGDFPVRRGGLELLAGEAADLVRSTGPPP